MCYVSLCALLLFALRVFLFVLFAVPLVYACNVCVCLCCLFDVVLRVALVLFDFC